MPGVNKAILIGNLGKDPELKYLPSGDALCSFSIATSESWKGQDGEKKEKIEWHNIVVFRKLAEICGQYLFKGMTVYVEGKIATKRWEESDGTKRNSTDIIVDHMVIVGSKPDENKKPYVAKKQPTPQPEVNPEELPF